MNDDPLDPARGELERQLDEFYRKLDGPARRVEARWKSTPAVNGNRRVQAWLAAGVAAAAAILLMISALRSDPRPVERPMVRVETPEAPPPRPVPAPVRTPPVVAPKPAPVDPPRPVDQPRTPQPAPEPPAPPVEPKSAPPTPPAPRPSPEPPKPAEPAPTTRPVRVLASLRETEGTFDLADKTLRGKQKDLSVGPGDRLRASTTVKLTLGDDRFVLLAPRTVVEFRPEEKRLSMALEQGDLLADLGGVGQEVRVVTKACEITPLGTVFAVKVDPGRVMVTVEKGRVDVQSPKGRAVLKAAEALQASPDGTLGTPGPADFRALAWARTHRAAETTPYLEEFTKPGPWVGDVEKGVIRAVAKPGTGAMIQVASEKPPLFEVPVRGFITIVCRADRAGKFKVQLYSPDQKTTYTRQGITILKGDAWRTVTVDFDDLAPSDKTRPTRLPPGSAVTDLLIMYGEEEDKGNFWVDTLKITELRP
jgi:ferric-dicitrate binding protein FerR (iron transport regulator)